MKRLTRASLQRLPPEARAFVPVLALFTLLAVCMMLGGLYLFTQVLRQPDYEFLANVVQPEQGRRCPGDYLDFTYVSRVNRAPIAVGLIRTFFDVNPAHPGTVVFGDHIEWVVHTRPVTVRRTMHVPVPQLPPGRYEWREGAQSFELPTSAFSVPFEVPGGCP